MKSAHFKQNTGKYDNIYVITAIFDEGLNCFTGL